MTAPNRICNLSICVNLYAIKTAYARAIITFAPPINNLVWCRRQHHAPPLSVSLGQFAQTVQIILASQNVLVGGEAVNLLAGMLRVANFEPPFPAVKVCQPLHVSPPHTPGVRPCNSQSKSSQWENIHLSPSRSAHTVPHRYRTFGSIYAFSCQPSSPSHFHAGQSLCRSSTAASLSRFI